MNTWLQKRVWSLVMGLALSKFLSWPRKRRIFDMAWRLRNKYDWPPVNDNSYGPLPPVMRERC